MTDPLTIAITGATGFLGGHLVAQARSAGHRVRALSRKPVNTDSNQDIVWITGALNEQAALEALVTGADIVVHAAGAIKALSRFEFFQINKGGTEAVVRAACAQGVKSFVLISSLAAREPTLSPYAASKRAAELVVDDHAGQLNSIILRPPAIYGPGDEETMGLFQMAVNGFMLAPGHSSARLSLVHVSDVASAILACCEQPQSEVLFEIDDGKADGYQWRELADAAGLCVGRPIKFAHLASTVVWIMGFLGTSKGLLTRSPAMLTLAKVPELRHRDWVANAKCPSGWTPKWSLKDGFKDAIDWYSSQNVLKRYF
ncbi:MAG: NAD-dependent epimerase/dehydratase family protein [Rhodospirillaceae bacterium]|nr:NAD-dependent epimerase/dehydratase family protein [Rhodospirillaceae bacterium]